MDYVIKVRKYLSTVSQKINIKKTAYYDKQTVTDGCKWAYRDFLNAQLNLIDNDDLKYCYGQAIHKGNSNPIDSFLSLIKSQDNSAITAWFDMANKSCKF